MVAGGKAQAEVRSSGVLTGRGARRAPRFTPPSCVSSQKGDGPPDLALVLEFHGPSVLSHSAAFLALGFVRHTNSGVSDNP